MSWKTRTEKTGKQRKYNTITFQQGASLYKVRKRRRIFLTMSPLVEMEDDSETFEYFVLSVFFFFFTYVFHSAITQRNPPAMTPFSRRFHSFRTVTKITREKNIFKRIVSYRNWNVIYTLCNIRYRCNRKKSPQSLCANSSHLRKLRQHPIKLSPHSEHIVLTLYSKGVVQL